MEARECSGYRLQLYEDTNAAINILKRATTRESRSNAQGDSTGLKIGSGIEELGKYPTIAGESHTLKQFEGYYISTI